LCNAFVAVGFPSCCVFVAQSRASDARLSSNVVFYIYFPHVTVICIFSLQNAQTCHLRSHGSDLLLISQIYMAAAAAAAAAFDLRGKRICVTGGGSGIGRALCVLLAKNEGVKAVSIADIDVSGAAETARLCSSSMGHNSAPVTYTIKADVSSPEGMSGLIDECVERMGGVDVFFSNAGIMALGGADFGDDDWDRIHKINVMSHVWAARRLRELWRDQTDGGYFIVTASAAGLLTTVRGPSFLFSAAEPFRLLRPSSAASCVSLLATVLV
jgi:short chain dehydrogenase